MGLPAAVWSLEEQGEKFYPLELAALVHEESSELAKKLRTDAIDAGDNIVIDTVLSDTGDALDLGRLLHEAGYDVNVIDVEVPYELPEERIHSRWGQAYTAALDGDDLGAGGCPASMHEEYSKVQRGSRNRRQRPERLLSSALP